MRQGEKKCMTTTQTNDSEERASDREAAGENAEISSLEPFSVRRKHYSRA